MEEFKYLRVFKSEGKKEQEIDRRIGAASAVMGTLKRSAVVKRELSQTARLSIHGSICIPTLAYGHELWVVSEKNEIANTSGGEGFPSQGGWAQP